MKTQWTVGLAAAWMLCIPLALAAQEGDPYTLQLIDYVNGGLKAQWMDLRVEQVEALDMQQARASARLHPQSYRWVTDDPRRSGDGSNLTYLIDGSRLIPTGATADVAATAAAIDRAMATWGGIPCKREVGLLKRPYTGEDPTIFDAQLGFGGYGNWRAADIVVGGWMPPAFFDAVVPAGGRTVLALSVTFIFVGVDGQPTDVDHDGNLDIAANEIFFNAGFTWSTAGTGMDVQTAALHEIGHSLGLGHLGPPPTAVMNPVYAGARLSLKSLDRLALCQLWDSR